MKILIIGDSCLDVFIYGDIERLAPEAPVPVIKPLHQKTNPGMAGNVAANLKALKADVDLITNDIEIKKIRYVDERYNQMVLRVDENDKCDQYDGESYYSLGYDAILISDYNLLLTNIKWLPLYPATLFMPLTKERSKKYINRWIKRNNVKRGWIIFGRNEYWHKEIYEKIDYSLDDMKITKKIAYKDLQAFLYEPK